MNSDQEKQLQEINQKLMKKIAEYSFVVVEELSQDYQDWCSLSITMVLPTSFQKLSLMFQSTSIDVLKDMIESKVKHDE